MLSEGFKSFGYVTGMFIFRNENIDSILPVSPKETEKEVMPTYIDEKHVPICWGKSSGTVYTKENISVVFSGQVSGSLGYLQQTCQLDMPREITGFSSLLTHKHNPGQ